MSENDTLVSVRSSCLACAGITGIDITVDKQLYLSRKWPLRLSLPTSRPSVVYVFVCLFDCVCGVMI